MKRTFGLIMVMALAGFMTISCSSLKKMKKNAGKIAYVITPETLVEKGGMVDVKIDVTFPEKYFNRKITLEATPVLRFNGGERAFVMKAIQGENVIGNNEVVPYESGKRVSYYSQIPYEYAMRLSELDMDIVGFKGLKSLAFDPIKIADGVISTATLMDNEPIFMVGEDKFQRVIKMQEEAAIHYLINSAQIRNKEMTSEDIKNLENYIKSVVKKENMNLNGMEVRSYASPDGPYDFNDELSKGRDKNATSFIKSRLRQGKIEQHKDADFFKQYVVAEDWDGFQKAMEASNIQDKDLILRVLSMYSDPEVREREIKNISSAFTVVADQILPKLRRSIFVVNSELIGKSDEEIRTLAKSDPASLDVEELLYAATLYDSNSDKLDIYEKVVKYYPNDWRGQNNIAMIKFREGADIDVVKRALSRLGSDADAKVVANNMAAIAISEGDRELAATQLGSATGAGNEVNYNKGMLSIMTGNYGDAVNYFGEDSGVNAALANILAENYNEAIKKLDAGVKTPISAYLKAIIGARTNDVTMLINNLREAIAKDATLKSVAATDMEFVKYFNDSSFINLVK